MRNVNDMDGAVGFTQSGIPPSGRMTYSFTLDVKQCGTFWYHAHSQLQRADGLYGGLVIHCPSKGRRPANKGLNKFDDDKILFVGDLYHRGAQEILDWYRRPGVIGNEVSHQS